MLIIHEFMKDCIWVSTFWEDRLIMCIFWKHLLEFLYVWFSGCTWVQWTACKTQWRSAQQVKCSCNNIHNIIVMAYHDAVPLLGHWGDMHKIKIIVLVSVMTKKSEYINESNTYLYSTKEDCKCSKIKNTFWCFGPFFQIKTMIFLFTVIPYYA